MPGYSPALYAKSGKIAAMTWLLQFRYEPQSYARALLTFEQNRINTNALALAATGKDKHFLLNRVKRILGQEQAAAPFNQKLVAYLFSALDNCVYWLV